MIAWVAHLYTASGAVVALLATAMTFAHDFRAAFLFLVLACFIDSTDGVLARAVRVKERLPDFDGAKLDDIVDYLTYVFVPALIVWRAELVPAAVVFPICAAMLLSSAFGFVQSGAKIESPSTSLRAGPSTSLRAGHDHFFTGFPSYWNIVAVYLYLLQLPQLTNAIILGVLAVLVFVPIRYLYPSRTRTLKVPTLALGATWAAMLAWMVWRLPAVDGPWALISLIFPVYYVVLSLWLQFRR